MDQESSQQLRTCFLNITFAPNLVAWFVTLIVSVTPLQIWREKMSKTPRSTRLLRWFYFRQSENRRNNRETFQGVSVEPTIKAYTHNVISCTQPFSNSPICKLSLWFQHNSAKESYDTNRIVCIDLKDKNLIVHPIQTAICCWKFTKRIKDRKFQRLPRLRLHGAIYGPDSFVLRYCANLKAMRYDSTSLNRIVADTSHRVIVAIHFNYPFKI